MTAWRPLLIRRRRCEEVILEGLHDVGPVVSENDVAGLRGQGQDKLHRKSCNTKQGSNKSSEQMREMYSVDYEDWILAHDPRVIVMVQ